jgi:TetR/AcrR family transcriptional regulator, tetracycline repressor protein
VPSSELAERRPRSTLTEEQIVDAALRVIRADGVDGLTMRRLSRELGVSAMAAYYYVANKQELLDIVAARALADITVPGAELSWHVRLRMLIDRIDAELRHYRGVEEVLLERMHSTQRHVMRAMMELLAEAGFDDAGVVMAYATVHTYLFGRYRVTLAGPPHVDSHVEDEDDIVDRLRPTVASLHGRDYYEFGVDTVVAGLRAQLRKQRRNGHV